MTRKLTFKGIVQGIGFRPTAQRLASALNIKGQVKNSGGNAELIIHSDKQALDNYVQRLVSMFKIESYTDEIIEDMNFEDFSIAHSQKDNDLPFLTPDLATCKDCENELKNPSDRRYHHPFISCINCGPRYSILHTLPYDRENTVMAQFDLCSDCKTEYTNPTDRRCHAQTIACNTCGPKTNISIQEAVHILNSNSILAIKDIGGYHLACKTEDIESVKKIRQLKGREAKPFAVMFRSIEEIEEYCFVNEKEKSLLLCAARPIVLLEKKKDFDYNICKDSEYIGAFLPCNPIQIMLLEQCSPLVMTSANISGEPIITKDEEIKKFNVPILSHNRDILTPLDDSVMYVIGDKAHFIRRARGYTPLAVKIDNYAKKPALALGGDLKAVFAYHKENYVFLSQHFGDLENNKVLECYKSNIERFGQLHSIQPEMIIADKHPRYYSSNLFHNDIRIQHHKAHIASVIAEHRLKGDVLGFAFDGTGYGDDGAVWGSEAILFSGSTFERISHLTYTKMPASDEISRDADLALACYLGGNTLIEKAIENNINTINSSSMGRLFDAVCALLDIKHYNHFEGECAVALESTAKKAKKAYPLSPSLNPSDILKQIENADAPKEELALGFHMLICRMIVQTALEAREKYSVHQIALSGGTFNNRIITENTISQLEENGFAVYTNELVPCGDGGVALGQAFIASLK